MLNVVDPVIPILNSRKVQQGQQGLPMPIVDITLQCENTVYSDCYII